MPDITMCKNESCKRKQACYRYTATPNPKYQSYAYFDCEVDEKDLFVDVKEMIREYLDKGVE